MIADGAVHAAALVAGVIGFSVLFQKVALRGATSDGVAMAIYAVGFFLLFGFSCAYNMTPPSPAKWLLRRFDHASIYLMIGGTYTALLSQVYLAFWAIALSATVWTGALGGASLKLFLPGRFDRASLGVYLVLGWSALIAVKPLVSALPAQTLASSPWAARSIRSASPSICGRASSIRTPSGTPASPPPPPAISPACSRR